MDEIQISARDLSRFWEKVNKTDHCWEWQGSCSKGGGNIFPESKGYGYFWLKSLDRHVSAHRFSYLLHYGEFDYELLVCHTCDNPQCVNPSHLFLGTDKDNVQDCISKKRRYSDRVKEERYKRTHFNCGHEITDENSRKEVRRDGKINLCCRTCDRRKASVYRNSNREKINERNRLAKAKRKLQAKQKRDG